MNFKTTVLLIILLAILGGALYFVKREKANEPETPKEKKLVDIDMKDVLGVTVVSSDGKRLSLEPDGMNWKLTEPITAPAETFAAEGLVRELTDMKSRGVVDASGQDAKAMGLDSPRFMVEIRGKDNKTAKLKVGERSAVGGNVYVLVNDDPKPRLVASSLSDQLEKPYTDFRQKKLVSVAAADIKQIEIAKPDAPKLVLRKSGENWQVVEPKEMPADSSEISNLTFAIAGLSAQEFVSETDVPPFLRPASNTTMSVWFSKDAPSTQPSTQPATKPSGTTITFGGFENVMKKNVYVAVSDPPTLAKVMTSSMDSFDKKPLDLRDKTVLKIEKNSVESISIQTNKPATTQPTTKPAEQTTTTIVRNKSVPTQPWHAPLALPDQTDAKSQATTQPTSAPATAQASTEPTSQASTKPAPPKWEIASDPKGAADESAVDSLLAQLTALRAEKFLEKNPTSQPSTQYTLTIATASGTQTINITDPGGSQNPVAEYNGLTFELSRFFLEKLTAKYTPGASSESSPTPSP